MEERNRYADVLLAARHHRPHASPASPPADYTSAMRVQREVARALGETVAGWKVGFSPDGVAVAAPLYASVMRTSPATVQLVDRGYIVEIELAFRLARDLAPKSYAREEILEAVDETLIGIELVAGRLGEPPDVPYLAFLADNIGNAGYVVGASIRTFATQDLRTLPLRLIVDGEVVQELRGGHPQGDPVEPLRVYASRPNDALGGLRKGQVITTGTLTKPLRVDHAAHIEASMEGVGSVACDLTR